jgi:hypothetical protein
MAQAIATFNTVRTTAREAALEYIKRSVQVK